MQYNQDIPPTPWILFRKINQIGQQARTNFEEYLQEHWTMKIYKGLQGSYSGLIPATIKGFYYQAHCPKSYKALGITTSCILYDYLTALAEG